ncbi:hypothetical protein HUJ04_002061 [Dendroctonus ponderosae]|nr:hypothetical protein HUJ04_002061 [Dendroctonus ponderosae]
MGLFLFLAPDCEKSAQFCFHQQRKNLLEKGRICMQPLRLHLMPIRAREFVLASLDRELNWGGGHDPHDPPCIRPCKEFAFKEEVKFEFEVSCRRALKLILNHRPYEDPNKVSLVLRLYSKEKSLKQVYEKKGAKHQLVPQDFKGISQICFVQGCGGSKVVLLPPFNTIVLARLMFMQTFSFFVKTFAINKPQKEKSIVFAPREFALYCVLERYQPFLVDSRLARRCWKLKSDLKAHRVGVISCLGRAQLVRTHTYLGVVKSLDTARRVSEIALQDGHPCTFTVHFKFLVQMGETNRFSNATRKIVLIVPLKRSLYIHINMSSSPQTPLVSLVPNKKVASERPEEADSTNFDPCEQCSVDFRITLLMLLLQDF